MYVSVTHLCVEHDLRCAVPPGGHVLCEGARVVVVRVGDAAQAEVADAQVAVRVEQQVRRLQVAVQHVGRVDVLKTAEDLKGEPREFFYMTNKEILFPSHLPGRGSSRRGPRSTSETSAA